MCSRESVLWQAPGSVLCVQFSAKIHEDFLNVPIICDLQVMVGRLLSDFNLWLQFSATLRTFSHVALACVLPAVSRGPSELSGTAPWALRRCSFQQLLRDWLYPLSHLRVRVRVWTLFWTMSCLQFPAAPSTLFRSQFPAGSFHGQRIQLRVLQDIGNIRTRGRGVPFVQACSNQTQ